MFRIVLLILNKAIKIYVFLHQQKNSWSLKRISEYGYIRAHATRNGLDVEVSILHRKLTANHPDRKLLSSDFVPLESLYTLTMF